MLLSQKFYPEKRLIMSESIGIYIHIPFCKSKCPYCDFFSGRASETDYDNYMRILKEKIKYWSVQTDKNVATVYFGGGTPSVLGADRLSDVLYSVKDCFTVEPEAEITVEVNPDTGKTLDFEKLRLAGFNRVSVGFQTAVERELKALGRIHTAKDAHVTTQRAKAAGIDNVSLDLMMGIPYQDIDSLKESIDFCAKCGVKHISSYLLKIEEGTRFFDIQDQLDLADDDKQAQLYLFAVDYLDKLGYKQYEISNFAIPGYESRHNSAYWKCGEYIGIGPSAHSFLNGRRFCYGRDLKAFEENIIIQDGEGGDEEEYIMLSLRLKSGLVFGEFEKRYHHRLSPLQMKKIGNFARAGFMELDSKRACFTPKGFLVSNAVISELLV